MEMLVTKFSNGKYRNEGDLFAEPISADNVKLMGEMIALQALRTVKKFDMKVADKLYIGLIKDLHHMSEIDYIVSDGYDVAQTAICFLYQFVGHTAKAYMRKAMEETIPDKEQRKEYVERNNERKKTNAIRRKGWFRRGIFCPSAQGHNSRQAVCRGHQRRAAGSVSDFLSFIR